MPDGRYTPDGKAGLRPDEGGVGLAQWLACQRGGACGIDLIAARGQKQDGLATGLTAKDDGLGNLFDVAANGVGCIRGGACQRGFEDFGVDPGGFEGGADAFQALAHMAQATVCGGGDKGH